MTSLKKIEDALERNRHFVAGHGSGVNALYKETKQALADIKAIRESIPDTKAALMNAVKPDYDIYTTCQHCNKEGKSNNGEWLLWCGSEKSAQSLLDAAKILNEL